MKATLGQSFKEIWRDRHFLICTLLLAILAGGMEVLARKQEAYFRKLPLELRKPLDELAENKLGPYVVIKKHKIEDEDVESELGTNDYIQWQLEDRSAAADDPARSVILFITYYTGDPDIVPHIPEVCYQGGGGQVGQTREAEIRVSLSSIGGPEEVTIPVRIVDMQTPSSLNGHQKIVYFFSVNGDYKCTRNQVRMRANYWLDRYSYYSKVELDFLNQEEMTFEQALSATEKVAGVILPELITQHWPLWPPPEESAKSEKSGKVRK